MAQGCMLIAGVMLHVVSAGSPPGGTVWNHLPPDVPPALGCWFWHAEDLTDRHYRDYVDVVAQHTGFALLTTSLRIPQGELTDDVIHDAISDAAEYARQFGIGIVMDLDVRLAREAFQRAYPNELQEMLRIREAARAAEGETFLEVTPEALSDHYTGKAKPYLPVSSRLVRVYAFARGAEGIAPDTVTDITAACRVDESTDKRIRIAVPSSATTQPVVCACVAFAHLTPDVFAPHLLAFQRDLLRRYADANLAGACKDEWGFPPCFDGTPAHNDFWYSEPMAAAYRTRTGRDPVSEPDLVRDCLLMYAGEAGREADRQGAVNHFMEMNRQRNVEIEGDFYQAVKEVFGPAAMVSTHPTWYPFCDRREFKKNGLDWWAARRDFAQTDEVTPFCVRTALAKKWNNSVWYNMFYAPEKREYETAIWSHALAGGRVNFHPLYPLNAAPGWNMFDLFTGDLMRGEARIRLLNFITPAPLDCRVAVVFGHACAMNWAGPAYEDVGLGVVEPLWRAGYYADLIPSSEIESGALKIDGGHVAYGTQRYDVLVLYHPEFEKPVTGEFLRKAAEGQTALCRVGEWTRDFDGKPFDGNAALPPGMRVYPDAEACVDGVLETMAGSETGSRKAPAETPAIDVDCWNSKIIQPPRAGHCRLVDGTRLVVAGENDPAGDPIQVTLDIDGHKVTFDAAGIAAVRLAADGSLAAMAAGGLKHFDGGDKAVDLVEPLDLALWRDSAGAFHGVVQDNGAEIPPPLTALTNDWHRLALPVPLTGSTSTMTGDSLVLVKAEPGKLCGDNLVEGAVTVRSTYEPGQANTVVYEAGRDYIVDYAAGTIARTVDSRIPDFSTNMLYGQKEFDHNLFPGFGNGGFFVFVDYTTRAALCLCEKTDQSALLSKTAGKLRKGGPFKIVAYGDSITAGGDATSLHLQFQQRWAQYLSERFPQAQIAVENGATGGDGTAQGLQRLREKVLDRAPGLVLIGFGMNDHNIGGPSPEQFTENLKTIVTQIRDNTGAEVILFSAFPPNPDWKFGTHRMELYAAATRMAAEQLGCAYADVYSVWMKVLARKDLSSLLGNNINHPNDFGHWLYFQALKSVEF